MARLHLSGPSHRRQRPGTRRFRGGPVRSATATVALVATQVLALHTPAWAHDHGVPALPLASPGTAVFVRCLVLVATAVAAGMAVLAPLAGAPTQPARLLMNSTAVTAALADLVAIQVDGARPAFAVALALATLALPGLRSRQPAGAAAGALVCVALAIQATAGEAGAIRAAGLAYTLAAALWLAWAATVATMSRGPVVGDRAGDDAGGGGAGGTTADRRPAGPRRLTPWAGTAAGTAAVAALLQGWLNGVRPDATAWWFPSGRLTVLQVGLLAGAGGLGLVIAVAGRAGRAVRTLVRIEAAALAGTLVAGVALAAAPRPPAPPVGGVPLLRYLTLAGQQLPVFVVPQRPGWNLVHVGADEARTGLDRARLTRAGARPGATGSWALVRLPAGRSRLWISHGGALDSLTVDTGQSRVDSVDLTAADGPECASASLGAVVAGGRGSLSSCPAQQLTPQDAAALRVMVRFVAQRHITTISVVGDRTPRGVQAVAVVRAAAQSYRIAVGNAGWHPLFVVCGWAAAQATLQDVSASRLPSQGSYLAPWLLTGPLLTIPASPLLPLRFDTRQPAPLRYLATLDARFPGETPTAAGYTSWTRARPAPPEPLRIYAAAQLSMPGEAGHRHQTAGWVPNGTVTAVTGPLTS